MIHPNTIKLELAVIASVGHEGLDMKKLRLFRSERNLEGLAPKTVHGIGTLLRQIFRRAVKWGYLENNPLDFVDLPEGSTRRQKRPRSLTPAEYLALVELYGPRDRAAIEVAGWMGPRRSEGSV